MRILFSILGLSVLLALPLYAQVPSEEDQQRLIVKEINQLLMDDKVQQAKQRLAELEQLSIEDTSQVDNFKTLISQLEQEMDRNKRAELVGMNMVNQLNIQNNKNNEMLDQINAKDRETDQKIEQVMEQIKKANDAIKK